MIAYRQVPHRLVAREHAGNRRPVAVRAVVAARLPASGVEGMRLALEPGRGRTAVPVRSALAGAVLAMTVVSATLTFGASLTTLVSHPALYGWNFDYALYAVQGWGQRACPVGRAAAGPRPGGGRHHRSGLRDRPDQRPDRPGHGRPHPTGCGPADPVRARARRQPRPRPRPGHPGSAAATGRRHRDAGQRQLPGPAQDRRHGHHASDRQRAHRSYLDEYRGTVLLGHAAGGCLPARSAASFPGRTPS